MTMGMNEKLDFAMERRLRDLSPELHRRFTEAVFGLQNILTKYQKVFPNFTDHSELHSLSVIDFSNHIIGNQIGRLNADEIDVLASRNPILLYDMESLTEEHDIIEFGKHQTIRALDITKNSFILLVDPSDPVIMEHIRRMVVKMQKTLDDCRRAVLYRTPYLITQKEIRLETL